MLLSILSDQKQDHPPKFLSLSPRRPNPVHPKSGLQLGVSFLFLHDAVDYMRMGFEPAGQTEGSQIDGSPSQAKNSLLRLYMSIVAGRVLSKTSFSRSLASCPLLGSYSASWVSRASYRQSISCRQIASAARSPRRWRASFRMSICSWYRHCATKCSLSPTSPGTRR
jgi:hypothetical protein